MEFSSLETSDEHDGQKPLVRNHITADPGVKLPLGRPYLHSNSTTFCVTARATWDESVRHLGSTASFNGQ